MIAIIIPFIVSFISSLFTAKTVSTWYPVLVKPFFSPPSWIFGPVWTILFFLMGIALFLIWIKDHKLKKAALIIFGVQLVLNALWSVIFFGLQAPFLAFIEIIFLWFFILLTIVYFYNISKPAAYLLLPYILWVSFAVLLNFGIVLLN